MTDNAALIRQFYAAFEQKDYATMQSLYHDDASFSDPVFQRLNAAEVRAMWEMLINAGVDLKVSFGGIRVDEVFGMCRWEAWYTFSRTGRKVHNIIDASFEFKDGKILVHQDTFDFWRWTRQALGMPGILLGWTPFMRNKVRVTARNGLKKFMGEE
jgi:ketosteroid isomerase-like protein